MSLKAFFDPQKPNQVNIYADSLADLPLKQLQTYEQSYKIKGIYLPNYAGEFDFSYSPSLYKKVYGKMEELLKGIDDNFSPEKKFVYIYRRISKRIAYDYPAGYPKEGDIFQEKYAKDNEKTCRNLVNGLLKGKCVCAGYSNILRNACLLKGVPAIEITGKVFKDPNDPSYRSGIEEKTYEYHAWNQIQLSKGWIQVDDTWEKYGTTEYAGRNNHTFFDKHSMVSLGDYLRAPSHRVVDFDLENFINQELGFEPGTFHYTDAEINKYLDEMERLDMVGLDMSTLRDTVIHDQQENDLFEYTFGYSPEVLSSYGYPGETVFAYKEYLSKNLVTSDLVEQIHNNIEVKKGDQISRLKFLGFTDKQIDILFEMRFDPNTGRKVVNVVDNATDMFFNDLRSYGFSDFQIKEFLDAKFDEDTGKPLTNVRDYAFTHSRDERIGSNLPNATVAEIRRDFSGFHPVFIDILISAVNSGISSMETLKNLSYFLDRKDLYPPEQRVQIAKSFDDYFNRPGQIIAPVPMQEEPVSIPPINMIPGSAYPTMDISSESESPAMDMTSETDSPTMDMTSESDSPTMDITSESDSLQRIEGSVELSDLAQNFDTVPASARFEVLSQMSRSFERESLSDSQATIDTSERDNIQNDEDMEL